MRRARPIRHLAAGLCALCAAATAQAQDRGVTYTLYGTPGLIEMPSAISANDGQIAATVSLRFSRFGASGKAVLAGIGAGFALYIVNKISSDLGAVGTFSTGFAAFFPPVVAGLMGILALLYQEDG